MLHLVAMGSAVTEQFTAAMVSIGIVPAVVAACIIEALDGGLLNVILALGLTARPMKTSGPGDCFPLLKKLLRKIIPGYLVYHPVALRMKAYFPGALSIAADPAFKKSAIFGLWEAFATPVERNLAAFDLFESKQYISSKVCGNVEVHNSDSAFGWEGKRCSRAAPAVAMHTTVRQNARRLIGIPDTENGVASSHRPVKFIYQNPGVDFLTVFDFTHGGDGPSWIDVRPLSEYAKTPEVPLRLAQLKRSGRRISRLLDGQFVVANALPPGLNFSDTGVYQMVLRRLRGLHLECEAAQVVEIY
ncbi:hypothetical protein DFH07DRAFT_775824 [Mycena maculata]|uniref:Uncharacterized protein n=1 Tax=Mycena maculata TaxID=230809 RepID=A0AAD7IQA9_9AGAR|nr:hypothetical protein DFH07DRAFT_775824 [Mycena maculata]